ncbi:hypothetical protein F503_00325 [Ophiostoma piceae UAMH 11346]|uniref:Uncharacterized protein n=1 Tax=Ophiostoma piceae (strain UAMH 11346) TaxID=1262450 RepID=S3CM59_OPHP1|nr:hypothetical protein F503_00325 [Ophiostoma piceae UAMH 11346]
MSDIYLRDPVPREIFNEDVTHETRFVFEIRYMRDCSWGFARRKGELQKYISKISAMITPNGQPRKWGEKPPTYSHFWTDENLALVDDTCIVELRVAAQDALEWEERIEEERVKEWAQYEEMLSKLRQLKQEKPGDPLVEELKELNALKKGLFMKKEKAGICGRKKREAYTKSTGRKKMPLFTCVRARLLIRDHSILDNGMHTENPLYIEGVNPKCIKDSCPDAESLKLSGVSRRVPIIVLRHGHISEDDCQYEYGCNELTYDNPYYNPRYNGVESWTG